MTVAGTLEFDGTAVVPEPAAGFLLGAGLAGLAWRRRARQGGLRGPPFRVSVARDRAA